MATLVNLTTQRPDDGKEITKTHNYINPNATDQQVATFMMSLNSLSKNSLKNIEKVSKSNIEIPNQEGE